MRLHRFILPYAAFRGKVMHIEDAALAHQLRSVLRVRTGEKVILCDGDGRDLVATVVEYQGEVTVFEAGEESKVNADPDRAVTIYAAITKRDTFEWACQKAVECGATRIVPVISERTVKQNISLERLRTIVKEAAEQSGRGYIPEILEPVAFAGVVPDKECALFIAALGAEETLAKVLPRDGWISIAIGPEGGFSEAEVEAAKARGWVPVSLGPRVLRAETAVAVATYLAATSR